jgi:uncharacterized protein YceH (UPF0502 family)
MAVYALTRIEHGAGDGSVTVIEEGESIGQSSGITKDQLKTLVASGAAGSEKPRTPEEEAEEAEAKADAEARADAAEARVAELEEQLAAAQKPSS